MTERTKNGGRDDAAATEPWEGDGREPDAPPSRTVLVVDDDSSIVDALARRLRSHGVSVIGTADPMNGLAWFYERADVDLIVLDLSMPGLSGNAFLQQVRQRSDVPVVVLTGAGPTDQARALRAGATIVFDKPGGEPLELFVLTCLEEMAPSDRARGATHRDDEAATAPCTPLDRAGHESR